MTQLASSQDSQSRSGSSTPIRIIILCAALVAMAIAIHFTPIQAWLANAHQLRHQVRDLGFWKYPVTILSVAVLVACGVPRLLFCTAGGMVFGFWPGLIVVQIGTLLGSYAAFLVIRWGDRDHLLRRFPRLDRLASLVQEQGIVGVILLRQLPLHGTITNLCLGLSRVRHRDYLIGSAIGLLTEAIPATLIGTGMVKGHFADTVRFIVIAVLAASMIWLVAAWWLRKIRRTRSGSTLIMEASSAQMQARSN
jgi:uncharacterized membrane protein YdjX (TVP38/TMEM64 family)